jgi:hypothetical protein
LDLATVQSGFVYCGACGGLFVKNAKSCPICGKPRVKGINQKQVVGLVVICLMMGLLVLWCSSGSLTTTPQQKDQKAQSYCENRRTAYYMSQEFVKMSLKAPSSAEFPRMEDSEVSVNYLGDCTHDVRAYVDAQNSFGAKIRNRYYVKLKNQKGTETWESLNVQIIGR